MGQEALQKQRYELKYVIREEQALAIRDFVRCYLDIDSNGANEPDLSYPVHSLYLDSPAMSLYNSTINGDKNRFKLRIRFYDNSEQTPVFLEIKRRMNNIISKKRVGVTRSGALAVLAGQIPDASQILSHQNSSDAGEAFGKNEQALLEFTELVNQLQAQAVSHVAYRREAWIVPNSNAVRVTMDREVRCEADLNAQLLTSMQDPTYVFGDWVILELKFTNRFPTWFRELVEIFNLTQCGAAKYVDGVTLMNQDKMADLVSAHMELQQPNDSNIISVGGRDHIKRREQTIAATF